MKPESYLAWKEKPTDVIAPEWRAPAGETPRRRGIKGALAALGFGRRPRSNWIRDF
ncbi:MAG: hypothetical protein ACRD0O_22060 [Acidimicrobiia bacterium]